MSFKDQRRKKVQDASFTRDEFSLLRDALDAKLEKNPDHAVEDLFDYITKSESLFRFKKSLGRDFEHAKSHANTSLLVTNKQALPPKEGVTPFVLHSLLCLQAVCLVYFRDVLNAEFSKSKQRYVNDKEIFECFKDLEEDDLKHVGILLCDVYTTRNKLLHRAVRGPDNSFRLKPLGTKEVMRKFESSRRRLADSCKVLLSKYRIHFPHCKI